MMTTTPPSFAYRGLRQRWRGLLLLALALVLASQSFGLIHRLDSVHHPAETLCEICAHADQGSAPLATLLQLASLPPLRASAALPQALPYPAFRIQPPPARGPPAISLA